MVHLICLRCNRANPADAKFCGECGAGLLRRFCAGCHAINDAESHFCQSCGAALPASRPDVATAKLPPDRALPSLTDVARARPDPARPVMPDTAIVLQSSSLVDVPRHAVMASESVPFPARNAPLPIFRLPILLGVGAVGAALFAALLWPAQPERVSNPHDSSQAFVKAAALASTPPALAASPVADVPPAAMPETPVAPPAAAVASRESIEPVIPREVPAPAPVARPTPPVKARVPTRPEPAARECTPQVDALGLCEPNAKVAER